MNEDDIEKYLKDECKLTEKDFIIFIEKSLNRITVSFKEKNIKWYQFIKKYRLKKFFYWTILENKGINFIKIDYF